VSGVCGWFSADVAAVPVDRMAAPLVQFDQSTVRSAANRCGVVAMATRSKIASIEGDGGVLLALFSRSPMPGLLALWHRHGPAMCTFIRGAFTLVVIDENKEEALLAIDRNGVHSLCYQQLGRSLVFASNADALIRHPGVSRQIDQQAIYDYLYFHMVPAPGSIYREQQRLLPGEYVHFRQGRVTRARYWRMHFDEDGTMPFAQLKGEFLSTVQTAVRDAADGQQVAAFLGGGTDSSTITAMLRAANGDAPRTYSIGFDAGDHAEFDYARLIARHFDTEHQEQMVTAADVVEAIPAIAAAFDQPFGNALAVPTFYCAHMAKADGIGLLLGGDGGNELFGGNARYARQALFSRYGAIPSALKQLVIEPLLFGAGGRFNHRLFGRARSYIEQALVPLPARLEIYNLLARCGNATVLHPHFHTLVDTGAPLAALNETYWQWDGHSQVNQLLALDMKFTLADNDLPKVGRACELAGIGVAFPFLDDAVVAFSSRLTSQQKLNGTRLRYFFKQALRGILPPEVIKKKKHGIGLPFGVWLQTDKCLREFAFDNLSALKGRHLVRADFIDNLLNECLAQDAACDGTMVWVLLMLEQWFAQRRPSWSFPLPNTTQVHEQSAVQT
jgi:asparagine synthase (glutamine-hydrolysing)